jgi:hypothetical protein
LAVAAACNFRRPSARLRRFHDKWGRFGHARLSRPDRSPRTARPHGAPAQEASIRPQPAFGLSGKAARRLCGALAALAKRVLGHGFERCAPPRTHRPRPGSLASTSGTTLPSGRRQSATAALRADFARDDAAPLARADARRRYIALVRSASVTLRRSSAFGFGLINLLP